MNFYDISVTRPDGSQLSMSDYKGKVVLVVNTATGCGFTPHYEPLEKMYEKYHDQGLEPVQRSNPRNRRRDPRILHTEVQHSVSPDEEIRCQW